MRYHSIHKPTATLIRGPRGRIKPVLDSVAPHIRQKTVSAPVHILKPVHAQEHQVRCVSSVANRLVG